MTLVVLALQHILRVLCKKGIQLRLHTNVTTQLCFNKIVTVGIRLSDMSGNQMVDNRMVTKCHSVIGTIRLSDEMSGNRMARLCDYIFYTSMDS